MVGLFLLASLPVARRIFPLAATCVLVACPLVAWADYATVVVPDGANIEHRMFLDGFHFGTLISQADGALIFRPHPDQGDVNGWGTSYYLNPFLSDGQPGQGGVNVIVASAAGISVEASGLIVGGPSSTYGTFGWTALVTYNAAIQKLTGVGSVNVLLDAPLADAGPTGADLNLDRLASNVLVNVPLQTGGVGNTGDMSAVRASYAPAGDPRDFSAFPPDWCLDDPIGCGHFPSDTSEFLSIELVGDVNLVDPGIEDFAIARKPSLLVALHAQSAQQVLSFGGKFDSGEAQNFAADNVGINHLVLRTSTTGTAFQFDLLFESVPVPEQHSWLVMLPGGLILLLLACRRMAASSQQSG
jgi:hypothetical protein